MSVTTQSRGRPHRHGAAALEHEALAGARRFAEGAGRHGAGVTGDDTP